MNGHTMALVVAGIIGSGVAVIHGLLTHRLMTAQWVRLAGGDAQVAVPIRRLVPALLQFSTFNWFLGGLALIAAAMWLGPEARRVTGLLVGGRDIDEFVTAVLQLVDAPALRADMGRAGRKRVAERFTWTASVKALSILHHTLQGRLWPA